ncbi:iron ABC transporter permease [Homoserinibacter sp. YIM 151385]|uniref:iron ABC transporter permease n=1 Tax=Homoserinibacter sp. YIM 151385 TaxID=2985506 RepID=UPI0022F13181|nr:iron ABC transporter permease [Homoserinibacter sp. YIM 151385]WBU37261.1 iron ABC transporter permease [Homoserinibacter sp. YIM 151385]
MAIETRAVEAAGTPGAVPPPAPGDPDRGGARRAAGAVRAVGAIALVAGLLALAAGIHLTQGTSGLGLAELWPVLTGDGSAQAGAREILLGSRIPRLAAGITVGFALGVAGALFQSLARNALASPDTLAVTSGSYLAVALIAAFGVSVPIWASGGVAFLGGLAAAAIVLGLAGGAGSSTTRLILAGSAVMLALQAATSAILILFAQETTGLFAWGSGSLSQLGLGAFLQAAPVVIGATVVGVLLSRRLDVVALGDDTARSLGVPVRSTRAIGTLLAVLLTAAAVTLAGPIGFVGLAAPVITRLLGGVVPALHRHGVLLPASGLVGALVVVLADVVIRALIGAEAAASIPTGIATTLLGALLLIVLARRSRDAGPTRRPPAATIGVRGRGRVVAVVAVAGVLLVAAVVIGLLGGHRWLLLGDVALWAQREAAPVIRFALDERAPRVLAAVTAGAALALAGTLVQASSRNPLAEPGILGITGGAGLGAVVALSTGAAAGAGILPPAILGALAAFALVYGLAWRRGLSADRLVLIGIGVWYATAGLSTFLLLRANPYDTPAIYTWLSGTTYGRSWSDALPVAGALLLALAVVTLFRRELDLLALDDDTPRLAGVRLERTRLLLLVTAALLAAFSVSAIGVLGFVGLIAPHAARALVGGRHSRILPVAMLLGATLVAIADVLGRTVIAPAQIPAGIVVALVGAPYFIFLLARSRA